MTCCKNQTLSLPTGLVENLYTNFQLINCAKDVESKSSDLATTLVLHT